MAKRKSLRKQGIFITGTDTGVGKTVTTLALGLMCKEKGIDVGVMKPVQCAGQDAQWLKRSLSLKDPLREINPYFAKEPLSPDLAFRRKRQTIDVGRIHSLYKKLQDRHELMLVEGAGGLMVPLKKNYLISDLIKDLDLEVIIVSRLGLGTINHTLLTVQLAQSLGLRVKGIIFCESTKGSKGVVEHTNPGIIKQYTTVPLLGTIPFFPDLEPEKILKNSAKKINLKALISSGNGVSSRLAAEDKMYLWHPFTQMKDWLEEEPLVIDRARGSYLIDEKGNRYLDGVSSLWVNIHGHGHKALNKAIKSQVDKLSHSTLLGLTNTPAIGLAKKLVEVTPQGLEKVFYSDNGSTAAEIAIKIAYQYWQNTGKKRKTNIVHLENSYHGDTLGSVSVGGIDIFQKVYKKLTFKTIKVNFPDCYRAPRGKKYPEYAFECVRNFERMIKKDHENIAAFIVEPIVQGAAGMIVWPQGLLKRMRDVCRTFEVLFICDEVATGFGRTGKMFACEHEGVAPDILCLAKGLTGGTLPLAATLTTRKIYDGFLFDYEDQRTFFHGHTYTGNPLCCAAALANIDIFTKERTLARLQPKIKYLSKRLHLFYNLRIVGDVRQKGFMVGIELVADQKTKQPFPWEDRIAVKVCRTLKEMGVILRPLGNVLVIMPPLSISIKDLKSLLDKTYVAIKQTTEQVHDLSK